MSELLALISSVLTVQKGNIPNQEKWTKKKSLKELVARATEGTKFMKSY